MFDFLKNNVFGIIAVLLLALMWFSGGDTAVAPTELGSGSTTTITNPWTFNEGITISSDDFTNTGGSTALATTSVESFTRGGQACTLTDANGGTYTLTDAQTANCGTFTFAAGGAGQAVIALTMPATSTMALTIPNAGDCREYLYSAAALSAATTTTLTAGTGHDIIAATTNDDVIDGLEFSLIQMCRQSDGDVTTYVSELVHAD